jgi:hypothetical protein
MRKSISISCGVALAIASHLLGATNLLPNGDFAVATQITGWQTDVSGTAQWTSDDASGDVGSGSIQLDVTQGAGFYAAYSACFQVLPNTSYGYGGMIKVVDAIVGAGIECSEFSTADCSGASTVLGSGTFQHLAAPWTSVPMVAGTTGATAVSAKCRLSVAPFLDAPGTARFDQLFFDSPAATPVRLQSFDVE